MSRAGLKSYYGEELYRGGEIVLRAAAFSETWFLGSNSLSLADELRCCAKVLWDRGGAQWMEPLVRALTDLRVHEFDLDGVAEGTSREDRAAFLHGNGKNLWAVLANWKQAPKRFLGQFDWVLDQARLAFPDLIETIEFDRGEAYVFPPGVTDPADGLPPRRQADGLLTGLLQLVAIAGAKPGSILAIDEMENHLHPHAIRRILYAMQQRAEELDLTIILTTHSPVVLNDFRNEPEQVFELNHGKPGFGNPCRMSELHGEDWLAQSKLGTLYEELAFSAPPGIVPR
jgi:predicted ATPase